MRHLLLLSAAFFVLSSTATATEPAVATAESSTCLATGASALPTAPIADLGANDPNYLSGACSATADCGVHGPLTCNGNSSCSFVDRNCYLTYPPQSGYVMCDGVKTNCPSNSGCKVACHDDYQDCLLSPGGSLQECRDDYDVCVCAC